MAQAKHRCIDPLSRGEEPDGAGRLARAQLHGLLGHGLAVREAVQVNRAVNLAREFDELLRGRRSFPVLRLLPGP